MTTLGGERRARPLGDGAGGDGPVLYWMQRDQRALDNWALLHAQARALAAGRPLVVVFCLVPRFLGAARRQYSFMLAGLRETAADLAARHVPFVLLEGEPPREVAALAARCAAAAVVVDANPLRRARRWHRDLARRLRIPIEQVDAHNVVPAWAASTRQEWSAATLRPKLRRLLPHYLAEFPDLVPHPHPWSAPEGLDFDAALARVRAAARGPAPAWLAPGPRAARAALAAFLRERLPGYAEGRNDPTRRHQSDLSPYLHFGQLAPQRVALAAATATAADADREAFLEELIVRRELADNFCWHNDRYDQVEGFPGWARATLERHAGDPRTVLLSRARLEAAESPDPLWNAAQTELARRGKLHGYLRMYWAKQLLLWSRDAGEALAHAIALNDRWALDGRDPSGYAGCAWSIGGVHDRPWGERAIFGTVRSMTLAGCRRKFRVDRYLQQVAQLAEEAS